MDIKNIDDCIILWGMSCSGKTTFAQKIYSHEYYCFDYLYPWHMIETLGLSISEALKYVDNCCVANRYILDGWNLADKRLMYIPINSYVYVIYSSYEQIINQYRIEVANRNDHLLMYHKWYDIDMDARYFYNTGSDFYETDREVFKLKTRLEWL